MRNEFICGVLNTENLTCKLGTRYCMRVLHVIFLIYKICFVRHLTKPPAASTPICWSGSVVPVETYFINA